jgi:hypothetical protein
MARGSLVQLISYGNGRPTRDDDKLVALEMIAAIPGEAKLGAMVSTTVADALAAGIDGGRKRSCRHLVDAAKTGNPDGGMLPIGWRRTFDDRMAYLCTRHPDRLLCDVPQNPAVSYGCATPALGHGPPR